MLLLPLIAACAGSGSIDLDDTATTDDTAAVDIDDDGSPASEDCDDFDPRAYPGNEEVWDGRDNDCDGVVDGRGHFAGDLQIDAVAVFEGVPHRFELTCPTAFERFAAVVSFAVECSPDPDDPDAMLLLGETLTVEPRDNAVTEDQWSGAVEVRSSNGWDVVGQGEALWLDMDSVFLATELDTVSLELEGGGTLARDPDARRSR